MSPRKLILLLIIAALTLSLCSGCWNRREPELLGIALAVGFDYDSEKELYRVIAQLANPVAMGEKGGGGAGGGGGGGGSSFWTLEAEGHTPYEALRNLVETSSREIFWAHCRVALFSEKMARRGLHDIIDLFERNRQLRLIVKPVIVKGDLRKILEAEFPLEETGARGLDRFIVTTRFEKSIFPEKNFNEIIATLSQQGKEILIGRMEVLESEEKEDAESSGSTPPARIGGGALFRGDRMVGWASSKQVQGWGYVTGRAFRSNFVLESPAKKGNFVSIGAFGHSATTSLQGDESNWRVVIKVSMHGRIQEICGPADLSVESELTRSLERRATAAVRNRIEAAFSRSQELKSDIFGFGNLIYRKKPRLWEKIKDRWVEEIYPQLQIDLEIEFKILRSGLMKDPL